MLRVVAAHILTCRRRPHDAEDTLCHSFNVCHCEAVQELIHGHTVGLHVPIVFVGQKIYVSWQHSLAPLCACAGHFPPPQGISWANHSPHMRPVQLHSDS